MSKTITERHPHPQFPRLTVDLRPQKSRFYQATTFIDGKLRQHSTKTPNLPTAFKDAEDWYRKLMRASVSHGKQHPFERLGVNPNMAELFASYLSDLRHNSPRKVGYAQQKWDAISEFWRALVVTDVRTQTFKDFYAWRRRRDHVKNHTLHKDIVCVRQILRHALQEGKIDHLPFIPKSGTIEDNPRPWLTKIEWETLQRVSQKRITEAKNVRVRQQRIDADDNCHMLVNSMMRIDELDTLRFSACRVERNEDGHKMLICEVTGKRGTRTAVAQQDAAYIYERRWKEAKAAGRDKESLIFPHDCKHTVKELLKAANLYTDARGFTRNRKSLRSTAIMFYLLDHPNVNLMIVARNAGTSVLMIDKFYAQRLTAEMSKEVLSKQSKRFTKPSRKRREAELYTLREAARNAKAERETLKRGV